MESLGFVLMYFLRGSLPWQGLRANTKRLKYQRILERKQMCFPDVLCRGFPSEFKDYFMYCSCLGFEERPDYRYLRRIFKDLFERSGYEDDGIFDWDISKKQRSLANGQVPDENEGVSHSEAKAGAAAAAAAGGARGGAGSGGGHSGGGVSSSGGSTQSLVSCLNALVVLSSCMSCLRPPWTFPRAWRSSRRASPPGQQRQGRGTLRGTPPRAGTRPPMPRSTTAEPPPRPRRSR
jgi:hypothetical protein